MVGVALTGSTCVFAVADVSIKKPKDICYFSSMLHYNLGWIEYVTKKNIDRIVIHLYIQHLTSYDKEASSYMSSGIST